MNVQELRDSTTDAIRYWKPRRLAYNAVLAAIVLMYFAVGYPVSRATLDLDKVLSLFLLAVLANVAYCAAYVVDLFAQMSGYRDHWRRYRWMLFSIGILFAAILTRFWAAGLFTAT
jgi:hypothetical protein